MKLATREWGAGKDEVAVLVHAGRDSSSTWKDVGPWLAARGYHAIALDLPGHGGSKVPEGHERSLSRVAADMVETIAAARPDRQGIDLLVGHSLGGICALACVAEYPYFTRRLVVEDTPGQSFDPVAVSHNTASQIELARTHPNPGELLPDRDCVTPAQLADKVAAAIATDPVYLPELMRSFGDADINALVARSPVPTLVIVGRDKGEPITGSWPTIRDYSLLSGSDRAEYVGALKQGTLVEIGEVGHYVHTLAADRFTAALGAWLDA